MKNPLPYLALIAASLAPMAAKAQYNSPPDYTFGGMFPGMFGNNNSYGMPQGFMNNGQSPFLTMPAPQNPYANPQFQSNGQPRPAPFPASPMAQPTPYWMQTPQSARPPARFITDMPSVAPQNRPPGYAVFSPYSFAPRATRPAVPPRWAPLPGQAPAVIPNPTPRNSWAISPYSGPDLTPVVPQTPPKWYTP